METRLAARNRGTPSALGHTRESEMELVLAVALLIILAPVASLVIDSVCAATAAYFRSRMHRA